MRLTDPARARPGALFLAAEALAAAYLLAVVWGTLRDGRFQWDFSVYWHAASAWGRGQDPYDTALLHRLSGRRLPFLYPPLTLHLFRPFAALPLRTAQEVWLWLKLSALALLAWTWLRGFVRLDGRVPPLLFLVLGFGSTLLVDLASGNVSVFEQLLLWAGLLALAGGRTWTFALCVALAAQLKLTPVAFLGLLLFVDRRPRWAEMAGGAAVFAGVLGVNALVYPALWRGFVRNVTTVEEHGTVNASTLGLLRDLAGHLGRAGLPLPGWVPVAGFALAAAGVAAVTARRLLALRSEDPGHDARVAGILAYCAAFALVAPRMKLYSFLFLLPVAWWVLARHRWRPLLPLVGVLALVPSPILRLPDPAPLFARTFYAYLPLLAAWGVWALYLRPLPPDTD